MRDLPAELYAEVGSDSVQAAFMAELFFDSGTLRLWTGYGSLIYNAEEYFGAGNLIGVSPIEETQDTEAKGIVVSLNGIPSSLISLSLSERSRGRRFRFYLAYVSNQQSILTENQPGFVLTEDGGRILLENNLVAAPYRIFSGLMDTMEFTDNGESADIRLSVENALIIGQRAKISRYTAQDQKKRFPNDKGLDYINQLQDKEVVW